MKFWVLPCALVAASAVAACSGGSSSAPVPRTTGVASSANVTIRITVPNKSASARVRQYVSPSTQSVSVSVGGAQVALIDVTPSSPQCTGGSSGTTCTVSANVTPGNDSFAVATYDGTQGSGNVLSRASVMQNIVKDAVNTVTLTLDGVVAKVAIVLPNPEVPACTATSAPVTVNALDADGNTIVGSAPYDRTIAVSYSDASGDSTLANFSAAKPGDGGTIAYNGNYEPGGTITAVASGVPTATATFYPIPTVCHEYSLTTAGQPPGLTRIVAGSDGNMYFNEQFAHAIGKIVPTGTLKGTITSIPIVGIPGNTMLAAPEAIESGPDGKIYLADPHEGLDIFTPSTMTQTSTGYPTYYGDAVGDGPAADGRIWFADSQQGNVGNITTAGVVSSPIPLPNLAGAEESIIAGSDGAMWLTESAAGKIARIPTSGSPITEYTVPGSSPGSGLGPDQMILGPDGNLYFALHGSASIGQIKMDGTITLFPLPDPNSYAQGITAGPDGKIWFVDITNGGDEIASMTTSGVVATYLVRTPGANVGTVGINVGPDKNLWFTEDVSGVAAIGYLTI